MKRKIEMHFNGIGEKMLSNDWSIMYEKAKEVLQERQISKFIEAGSVAAAIKTVTGNIYVGVCFDTSCSLGMCAERNAIANMITNGEWQISKIVAVMPDGNAGMPCGACREFMMQLDHAATEIEILCDYETKKAVKLKELLPDWWA